VLILKFEVLFLEFEVLFLEFEGLFFEIGFWIRKDFVLGFKRVF
jgi:hypothetical protein